MHPDSITEVSFVIGDLFSFFFSCPFFVVLCFQPIVLHGIQFPFSCANFKWSFFFKIELITIGPGFCLLVFFFRVSRVLPWSCIGGPYLLFILILCLWLPFLSQIKCTNPNQGCWLMKSVYSSRLTHVRLSYVVPNAWSQVSWLTKSLFPSVLAQLGSMSSVVPRAWSQVSWLN